ncbi:MAG: lipopolysaccharide assembly protein LapA domain-containing protein [Burkholderiaceae bacterium]
MRIIVGALWLVLFLVLFAFAVNNTALTDLHFFAGLSTKAPLIALLLAFFIAGFAFGFIALMPVWIRQRVEIRKLRRLNARPPEPMPSRTTPPTFDAGATDVIQTVARGARTTT